MSDYSLLVGLAVLSAGHQSDAPGETGPHSSYSVALTQPPQTGNSLPRSTTTGFLHQSQM
jgi:hypothetical protein